MTRRVMPTRLAIRVGSAISRPGLPGRWPPRRDRQNYRSSPARPELQGSIPGNSPYAVRRVADQRPPECRAGAVRTLVSVACRWQPVSRTKIFPGFWTVLAAYDRTNAMALIAFLAVQFRLERGSLPVDTVVRAPIPVLTEPERELPLPPSLALTDMSKATAEMVLAINGFGATHRDPIIASMYRHLAHWPAYLALVWTMLAPLKLDQRLDGAIEDAVAQARAHACCLVAQLPTPLPAIRPVRARHWASNRQVHRRRDRQNGGDLFVVASTDRQPKC